MAEARMLFQQIDLLELGLCRRINRISRHRVVERLFIHVSRLGDGGFWYGVMALLPILYGGSGIKLSLQMGLVGLLGLLLYRKLKTRLVRERPFVSWRFIHCGTPALDRYSFPSGHTLHAVAFTTLLFCHFPAIAWMVMPFTVLVALSRVVLGLHYPSDVLAGAMIGFSLAWVSLLIAP